MKKSKFEISKVYTIRWKKYKYQKIRVCYKNSIPLYKQIVTASFPSFCFLFSYQLIGMENLVVKDLSRFSWIQGAGSNTQDPDPGTKYYWGTQEYFFRIGRRQFDSSYDIKQSNEHRTQNCAVHSDPFQRETICFIKTINTRIALVPSSFARFYGSHS